MDLRFFNFIALVLTLLYLAEAGRIKRGDPATKITWGYHLGHGNNGPEFWGKLYPDQCGEQKLRQSPIDILTSKAKYESILDDIDLLQNNEEDSEHSMFMLNNGHTASVGVDGDVYIKGGALEDVYKVAGFHFHWGSNNSLGSEHRIDGKIYPLELHIVTYDSDRYSSLGDAITGYNSLAVLGTLFEISEDDNEILAPIINKLSEIKEPNPAQRVQLPWIDLGEAIPQKTNRYFRYEGSLTTPPCAESVIWTVFEATQTISDAQLEQFRNLVEGSEQDGQNVQLIDNYRLPQPLHNRKVYSSFPSEAKYVVDGGDSNSDGNSASGKEFGILGTVVALIASFFLR